MRFCYYDIRACLDHDGNTVSFADHVVWHQGIGGHVATPESALGQAEEFKRNNGATGDIFWAIYGQDEEGHARAIGDFTSFESAYEVLNAILAPMAAARDLIREGSPEDAQRAADDLEDVILQSSSEERL